MTKGKNLNVKSKMYGLDFKCLLTRRIYLEKFQSDIQHFFYPWLHFLKNLNSS